LFDATRRACRVDMSGRSPSRQRSQAMERRTGHMRRAEARRERSHAQARLGRAEHGEHPPCAASEHHGTCFPVDGRHRAFGWPRPINDGNSTVGCALMSGLSCGGCRWPSWVCAGVSGTNLQRVLEAHRLLRYRLSCLDHSRSHHAGQRWPPVRAGSRPLAITRPRNVRLSPARAPSPVPPGDRPLGAPSTPTRCAPSCSPAPP